MSVPVCPLCGRPLAEAPSIALRGGGRCHRRCAERQAARAWRWRRGLALGHLALVVATLGTLAAGAGPSALLLGVGLAWAALHARVHHRYWHYVSRDLRRLGRRRGP